MANPCFPLLVMATAALVLAFDGPVTSAILEPAEKSQTKAGNYKCGIESISAHLHEGWFPVRYYLIAMTFVIFDVGVVFMYPWAVSSSQLGLFGFIAVLTFIVLITVPYAYEWRRGEFDY